MHIGDTVLVHDPLNVSNGTTEHPAIVTRVWGSGETPTINVKVFPDCGEVYDITSIQHRNVFLGLYAEDDPGITARFYLLLR